MLPFITDKPITSALLCHFVGIAGLYLFQGTINLIGSPAGCSVHHDNKLEGLDMGSYLKRESERNNKVFPEAEQRNIEEMCIYFYLSVVFSPTTRFCEGLVSSRHISMLLSLSFRMVPFTTKISSLLSRETRRNFFLLADVSLVYRKLMHVIF